jgi:very-short-patch-repair endonuclease
VLAEITRSIAAMQIRNRLERLVHRRALRRQQTPAEATLWNALRARQLHGRKFKRQVSIGPYIVDFYCAAESLAIEVDGESHATAELYDAHRERYLAAQGIRTLRYTNADVRDHLDAVLTAIAQSFTPPVRAQRE